MMNQTDQPLEDIKIIRKLMEESSRFLSLSGLSGIIAGILAIAGAVTAQIIISGTPHADDWFTLPFACDSSSKHMVILLFADMAAVLVLALAGSFIFSMRKAKKSGLNAWTPVTKRMLVSLFIPLISGGLFILLTLNTIPAGVSTASTLIFYGLAVISAGKFTFGEVHWLGVMELITGMVCLLLPQWSVIIWAVGFGLIHIGYGFFMHLRYEG